MFFVTDDDRPNVYLVMLGSDRKRVMVRERQIEIGSAPVALVAALYEMHHRQLPPARDFQETDLPAFASAASRWISVEQFGDLGQGPRSYGRLSMTAIYDLPGARDGDVSGRRLVGRG
jgi:hypothetical protein